MSKQRRAASVPGTAATAARKQPKTMRGPVSRMTIGSGSSGKRAGRPPSPLIARRGRPASPAPERVTLKDPERVAGGEAANDVESKLKLIVEQQQMDHVFLQQVAAAVRTPGNAVVEEQAKRVTGAEETHQLNVNLRRELYAMRDQLDEKIQSKIPEATQQLFAQGGPGFVLNGKLAETEKALAVLQLHVTSLTSHEEQVESYLEGLHQERPREGQAIAALGQATEFVHNEVGQVREMVRRFEPSNNLGLLHGPNCDQHCVPFTQEMSNHLEKLENAVKQHSHQIGEHQRGYNLMVESANAVRNEQGNHAQRILASEYRVHKLAEELAVLQQPTELNLKAAFSGGAAPAPGHGCAQGCGCSGGSPSGAWSSWQAPTPPGIPQDGRQPRAEEECLFQYSRPSSAATASAIASMCATSWPRSRPSKRAAPAAAAAAPAPVGTRGGPSSRRRAADRRRRRPRRSPSRST